MIQRYSYLEWVMYNLFIFMTDTTILLLKNMKLFGGFSRYINISDFHHLQYATIYSTSHIYANEKYLFFENILDVYITKQCLKT